MNTFVDRAPHLAHLAWRGVHRRSLLDAGLRLRAGRSEGLFADMLWVLETLLHGPTASVDGIHVDKDLRAEGLVADWSSRSAADKAVGVADNIARTAEVLHGSGLSQEDVEDILIRWAAWLIGLQGRWNVFSDDLVADALTVAEARPAIARLLALLALEGANPTTPDGGQAAGVTAGAGRPSGLASVLRRSVRLARSPSGARPDRR